MSNENVARNPDPDNFTAERVVLRATDAKEPGNAHEPLGHVAFRALAGRHAELWTNPCSAVLRVVEEELRLARATLELASAAPNELEPADLDAVHARVISLAERIGPMREFADRLEMARDGLGVYAEPEQKERPQPADVFTRSGSLKRKAK